MGDIKIFSNGEIVHKSEDGIYAHQLNADSLPIVIGVEEGEQLFTLKDKFTKETAIVKITEVIECPQCTFEFSTIHESPEQNGVYICPACNEAELESKKFKEALEEIAYDVASPIGEDENYKETVYKFIDIAKSALGY